MIQLTSAPIKLAFLLIWAATGAWAANADSPSGPLHNVSVTGVLTVSEGMIVTGTVNVSGTVSATTFAGDGSALTNLPGGLTPGGTNTNVQFFNTGGSLGGKSTFTFVSSTNTVSLTGHIDVSSISATTGIGVGLFSVSADTGVASAATVNVIHNCGAVPHLAWVEIINTTPELGFLAGQTVPVPPYAGQGANISYAIASDATSSTVRLGSASTPFAVNNLGTGNTSSITNADWNFHLKVGC